MGRRAQDSLLFYHSEKLQSTKTIPEQKHLLE